MLNKVKLTYLILFIINFIMLNKKHKNYEKNY